MPLPPPPPHAPSLQYPQELRLLFALPACCRRLTAAAQTEPPPVGTEILEYGAGGGNDVTMPPLVLAPHCSPTTVETSVAVSLRTCQVRLLSIFH